jgi:sigma-B regulation protein RsbU (phosphoserine phosphatase)
MQKGYGKEWRRLGRVEKIFLVLIVLYVILYFTRLSPGWQTLTGLAAFLFGLATLFRAARRGMKQAIWRLRNRLIAAYLFIAVVPIVLILTLVGLAGWAVIGQMAVYLVNTELSHRESALQRQAEILARLPMRDEETTVNRFVMSTRNAFPNSQLLVTGQESLRYPADAALKPPPPEWHHASGLVIRRDAEGPHIYAWAHVPDENGKEVTILAPIAHEVLADLIPGLGDVNFTPLMGHIRNSHVPAPMNLFDLPLSGVYPVSIPTWESPKSEISLLLIVDTRLSAVLGIVFGQKQKWDWGAGVLAGFIALSLLFLIVEILSLVAGVSLTRTITGSVHELYSATQHVKDGDFSYRIPVKGADQLAELAGSFNTMTANLGRLLVVAKEKERLESELEIAREVQNQLFPKDVPFSRSLELKGVCNPARMVSGDYYDFMPISEHSLAFAIGDVAGKGISAALLMATIQSTMRTQLSATNGCKPDHLSTARMVATLNKQLFETTAPEKYATFYFAMFEDSTNELTYTNAGHLAPILVRGNQLETLESTGTVVGAFLAARYQERIVRMQTGDLLVAYTDGIVEPENAYGEMFGEDRLKDLLIKYSHSGSEELIARTMEAVNLWTGSNELQDDMTMLVARRL